MEKSSTVFVGMDVHKEDPRHPLLMPDRQRGAAAERRILDGRYWSGSRRHPRS